MTLSKETILLGAHTSAAGGVHQALLEGQRIGATTIQLFTANQKRWESKPLTQDAIDLWNHTLKETKLQKIMSHDSYLINLGSPDPDALKKSRDAFKTELSRCISLGISFLNFHPGAALHDKPELCLDRISDSLLEVESMLEDDSTYLLLEMTAGQGSAVGYRFEQIAYILNKVKDRVPVGVCIDTCHVFVAGYDIRTAEGWDQVLDEFDRTIGLKYLKAFHVNDSMKGLGSRVDRHQHLGEGQIGLDCFSILMNHPKTRMVPKYLETPGGPERWEQEIRLLRGMIKK